MLKVYFGGASPAVAEQLNFPEPGRRSVASVAAADFKRA